MNKHIGRFFAALCGTAMAASSIVPAVAQSSEPKEKPPMYTYVGNWGIPRTQWGDMEKNNIADQKILDKALASGTIVSYGSDVNLVHQVDGMTHDDWWASMSMAGVLNVLDQFYKSGGSTAPVLSSATKHSDNLFVSRAYNWHAGSWKDVYGHGASYKLKADAPDDAVETLSKTFLVPFFEKLLADGTIHEYEIDTEAVHTESPDTFWVFYIAASAEGLDKVNAALRDSIKASPLNGRAFGSMVDFTPHRDYLVRTNATYK